MADTLLEIIEHALRSGDVGSFTIWGDSMGIVIRSNQGDGFCVRATTLPIAARAAARKTLEAMRFRCEEAPNEAAGERPEPLKSGAADNQESKQTSRDGAAGRRPPSVDGGKGPA